MSIRYGLQKMAVLDSANYDYAVIPLDASVGLLANNNDGKTSLVNALQFPLVPDRRRLSFGGHSMEASRKFYFPRDSSYILVELLTEGGTVVVGCVGMGMDHDFGHFAYAGALDLADFQTDDKKIVRQASLVKHMASRGYIVFRYKPDEFRDRLFRRARNMLQGEPDIGLFRLNSDSEASTFQTIFTRILRLDDLTAESIKQDLLEIYRNVMRGNVNFRKEWEQAFEGVNRDRAQLDAATRSARDIEALADLCDQRIKLRTRVVHQMGRIDAALEGWEQHRFEREQLLGGEVSVLRNEEATLGERNTADIEQRANDRVERDTLQAQSTEQTNLAERFLSADALTLRDLQEALENVRTLKHNLKKHIQAGATTSITTLEREIATRKSTAQSLLNERDAAGATLHAALKRALPEPALDGLARVLSESAMTLREGEFDIDLVALKPLTESTTQQVYLAGVALKVSHLASQYQQRTPAELDEAIGINNTQLDELQSTLETAQDQMRFKGDLVDLEQQEETAEQRLNRFKRLEDLRGNEPVRAHRITVLNETIAALDNRINTMDETARALRGRISAIETDQKTLADDNTRIEGLRNRRRERSSRLLAGMEHKPMNKVYVAGLPDTIPHGQLRTVMDQQHQDCLDLEQAERDTHDRLDAIRQAGLTKFSGEGGTEEEIKRIIGFFENRAHEEAAIARSAQAASGGVSSALAHLRDGLKTFEGKVTAFNRLITKRSISDLSVFRINVVPENRLVADIETVLSSIDDVDASQLPLLGTDKAHGSVKRALDTLLKQHELKLESLFSLEFEIGKKGHKPHKHANLKGAASDGTTAMAKLVIGLAMLSELRDTRHDVRAVCYLDEAARLDMKNQASLIAIAESFGYSLVMAAPSQLITPSYCVPIDIRDGRSLIDESRWMLIHHREPAPTPDLTEAVPA